MPALRTALQALLDKHVELVASGDCGHWDVEKEPEVIAAREVLAATAPGEQHRARIKAMYGVDLKRESEEKSDE